jgi:hypothetical protein
MAAACETAFGCFRVSCLSRTVLQLKIFHRGQWYSVCAGNFFREVPGGFVSEAIPKGVCLGELPEDELEPVDGEEGLYLFHDYFWKRRQQEGRILYEALGQVPG